jgi:hypothetical protein
MDAEQAVAACSMSEQTPPSGGVLFGAAQISVELHRRDPVFTGLWVTLRMQRCIKRFMLHRNNYSFCGAFPR